MFFDDLGDLGRVLVAGTLGYVALVLFLRVSGKRTLSKLNAFDLVITVALGSTLATIVLSSSVAIAEGVLALALLVGLQYAVAWTSVRSRAVRGLAKSEPRLLVHRGRVLTGARRSERVTADEILQAVRSQGHASLDDVEAVVLETDGTMSVVSGGGPDGSALAAVPGIPGP